MTGPTTDAAAPSDGAVHDWLQGCGFVRGATLGIALAAGVGIGLAVGPSTWWLAVDEPAAIASAIEQRWRPRWVWWSIDTPLALISAGFRPAVCWDLAAVHRMLFGGWRADPARVWARVHDLPSGSAPVVGQLDLTAIVADDSDAGQPVRTDGHLRAEWVAGAWADSPAHLAAWAAAAVQVAALQEQRLRALTMGGSAVSMARSESAAELLCAELSSDGLPVRRDDAESLISSLVGPRPASDHEAQLGRRQRDAAVLRLVPESDGTDLRNPAQVKALLRRVGLEVPDTRAWRLRELSTAHPVVEALLAWRKAERVATTYGYAWLDQHVGADGRLRGGWSASDGAAGRMTAQAGLHNMPADMREIVAADPGHAFVRADLGQIEPRVLAAISGDAQLTNATQEDDLYAPVARRLAVERSVAKVAVLAAMYGQTSGVAGQALRGLEQAYPVAMAYLQRADLAGQRGEDLRTFGGRLVRMWPDRDDLDDRGLRAVAAARGRYARNAMVQGAAAELFKVWAALVRARAGVHGARIVLCLHDELLVHTPIDSADAVKALLGSCLDDAARAWSPGCAVRFVLDASVIERWSEAKS